jgi:hypothetical protein
MDGRTVPYVPEGAVTVITGWRPFGIVRRMQRGDIDAVHVMRVCLVGSIASFFLLLSVPTRRFCSSLSRLLGPPLLLGASCHGMRIKSLHLHASSSCAFLSQPNY